MFTLTHFSLGQTYRMEGRDDALLHTGINPNISRGRSAGYTAGGIGSKLNEAS